MATATVGIYERAAQQLPTPGLFALFMSDSDVTSHKTSSEQFRVKIYIKF